jgi:hypothetical protein
MPVPTANTRPPDRLVPWVLATALVVPAGLHRRAHADPSSAHSEQGFGPPPAWQLRVQPIACALGEIEFASGPGTGAFDERIYVLLRDHGLVLRLAPNGHLSFFANLNDAGQEGPFASPTFDALGAYDKSLLLLAGPHHVGEIDANVQMSFFAPGGIESVLRQNLTLRCDPYGGFGGQLFLLDSDGVLCTVGACGIRGFFVAGFDNGEHAMLFSSGGAFGNALYVAEAAARRILRIQPDHELGTPPSVWLDLDELGISPMSMTISRTGIFGTDVMYVADADGDIIRLSAAGEYRGVLLTDLPGPAQIELPASAMFPDRMVVAAAGSIWFLYYEHVDLAGLCEHVDQDGESGEDDHVTLDDVLRLLGEPGDAPPGWASDPDGEGAIDLVDLLVLFGTSP